MRRAFPRPHQVRSARWSSLPQSLPDVRRASMLRSCVPFGPSAALRADLRSCVPFGPSAALRPTPSSGVYITDTNRDVTASLNDKAVLAIYAVDGSRPTLGAVGGKVSPTASPPTSVDITLS